MNYIIEFINKNNIETIENELLNLLLNGDYCDSFINRGVNGRVYIQKIGETIEKKINNKIVKIPVVVKENLQSGVLETLIIKNKLFLYSKFNLFSEILILLYINKLYEMNESLHLIYMFGYCADNENIKIITEKNGLNNKISLYNKNYFVSNKLFFLENEESYLETLFELLRYINRFSVNDDLIMPNKIKVSLVELIDNIVISYITTFKLLIENNIIPNDLHLNNIFIYWLNSNSYLNNKFIGNTKYICYKYKTKYIKIKTFGFVIKFGDVGDFIVKPKEDVFIFGSIWNNQFLSDVNYLNDFFSYIINFHKFFYFLSQSISKNVYEKTVLYKILCDYPYSHISLIDNSNIDKNKINELPNFDKLLSYFTKYFVNKPDVKFNNNEYFVC